MAFPPLNHSITSRSYIIITLIGWGRLDKSLLGQKKNPKGDRVSGREVRMEEIGQDYKMPKQWRSCLLKAPPVDVCTVRHWNPFARCFWSLRQWKKKKLLEINILYLLKGWHAFTFVLVKFDFGEIFNHRSILIVTVQKHVPVLHYALRLGMQ